VGPLQLGGLAIGIFSIVAGMLLFHTSRGMRETSALEFLLHERERQEQRDSRRDGDNATTVPWKRQRAVEREPAMNQ
jgi:hypothetical protein